MISVPPDVTPEGNAFYANEIYIDTTGYGIGSSIDSITVNGVNYPAGVYPSGNIGGNATISGDFASSLLVALTENGIDPNTFYTYGFGSGGNYVSFGSVIPSSNLISVEWSDGNGNTLSTSLVERVANNLCSTHTGDITTDTVALYNLTFPKYGGGTQTFNVFSAFSSTVEYIDSDYLTATDASYYYTVAFTPLLTPVQNGPDYTITGTNFYFPLNYVTTSNGNAVFTPC